MSVICIGLEHVKNREKQFPDMSKKLPSGTVTFLFTDVQDSTKLWEQNPDAMDTALEKHDAFLLKAIEECNGSIVKPTGDGFHAVFATAQDALAAALAAQRLLHEDDWGDVLIKVRMGLHTGTAQERAGDYFGSTTNRAARLMSAGYGGQILISESTRELIHDRLPAEVELLDLGKHRLKDLTRPEHIFQVAAPDLPNEFPPLKTVDYRPNNLPVPTTPFIGRDVEISTVVDELSRPDVRLLTILGPGGMGKSRLAIEVGKTQLDKSSNGVYFVSLAPLESADNIISTIAEAVKFQFYPGMEPKHQILDYFREKQALLIMDNFEHVLDGVELLLEILTAAPDMKILATSRAKLNLSSETVYSLKGMTFPVALPTEISKDEIHVHSENGHSAVKLFVQSAQRARPTFDLHPGNLANIAAICAQVDGLPLGIELAAAWVGMLSTSEIVAAIKTGIDFLETEARDIPKRHHSMRAVLDRTWEMIAEKERSVFKKLSVFRGGFTRQAATQIADASLPLLLSLANKSLIRRDRTGRYQVHELLRQYAGEKLGKSLSEKEQVRYRHCKHYAIALAQWDQNLKGPYQQKALMEIEIDLENVRTAWDWAVEHGCSEQLDQAMDGLCRFYYWGNHYLDGLSACQYAAEKLKKMDSGQAVRLLAKILTWQSIFSGTVQADKLLTQSLALLEKADTDDQDTRREKAFILQVMGDRASDTDFEQAQKLYEQSLDYFKKLGDQWETANLLAALGWVAGNLRNYHVARQLGEESLDIRRELGDLRGIADSLWFVGTTLLNQESFPSAEGMLLESLSIRREIGDLVGISQKSIDFGMALTWIGQFDEAHSIREEILAIYQDRGSRHKIAEAHIRLAFSKMHLKKFSAVRKHAQIGLELCKKNDDPRGISLAFVILGLVTEVEQEDYVEAQRILRKGLAVCAAFEGGFERSMLYSALAYAENKLGQHSLARKLIAQAFRHSTGLTATINVLIVLMMYIKLLIDHEENERAIEFWALASRYPFMGGNPIFEYWVGRDVTDIENSLSPDIVSTAKARGQDRDLEATVKELITEMEKQD